MSKLWLELWQLFWLLMSIFWQMFCPSGMLHQQGNHQDLACEPARLHSGHLQSLRRQFASVLQPPAQPAATLQVGD